jgi:delta24-sterol reductase
MSEQGDSLMVTLMTKYRTWVVMFFVIPLTFVVETIIYIRNRIVWAFFATTKLHDQRVRKIQEQIRKWDKDGRKKKLCTARPGYATMSLRNATFKDECNRIHVHLPDILELNTHASNPFVRTEPGVNMGYMTHYLIPKGYALKVQVEMEDLTVGGLTCGLGMETNSHKYGLFQETVLAYEIVLSDGSFVRATRTENSDLYYAMPWSHGSLGFLVAVELEVIPVKPYVHIRYLPCHSQEKLQKLMKEMSTAKDPVEFLEGIAFSRETAVVMAADFADEETAKKSGKINNINLWYKPYFYKHVESFLKTGPYDEYIPLREFYHRFTRSVFWEIEGLIPFCHNFFYRLFWGWLGAPKISLLKITMTPELRRETILKHTVQDIIFPIDELGSAINKFHHWFNFYPLWLCPIRIWKHEGDLLDRMRNPDPETQSEMYIDIGIYGVPKDVNDKKPWNSVKNHREMEAYAREVAAFQCPYADLFCTRSEFRQMFNHTLYDRVRQKYKANDAFPDLYDKVRPEKWICDTILNLPAEDG